LLSFELGEISFFLPGLFSQVTIIIIFGILRIDSAKGANRQFQPRVFCHENRLRCHTALPRDFITLEIYWSSFIAVQIYIGFPRYLQGYVPEKILNRKYQNCCFKPKIG